MAELIADLVAPRPQERARGDRADRAGRRRSGQGMLARHLQHALVAILVAARGVVVAAAASARPRHHILLLKNCFALNLS